MKDQSAFQFRVDTWMRETFSHQVRLNMIERGDRLLEEVYELLQAMDYPQDRAVALRRYTWSREKGEPEQEAGGVFVTFAALCTAAGIDIREAGETELRRVWGMIPKIQAKHASKPTGSALPQLWNPAEYVYVAMPVDGAGNGPCSPEEFVTMRHEVWEIATSATVAVCPTEELARVVVDRMNGWV